MKWTPPSRRKPPWTDISLVVLRQRKVQVSHLVLGLLTPRSLVVLGPGLHKSMHTKAEAQDISQLFHLLSTILESSQVAKVLSNSPCRLLGVDVLVVPVDQLVSSGHIFRDGFLGQHMLAAQQSLLDIFGLGENGQSDDYTLDVGALQ